MMTPYGVREICDVVLRAKSNVTIGNKKFYKDEPVLYFDTLKTSTLEGTATTAYATGGRGNSRLIAWEGERAVTFNMEDALISPAGFTVLTGAGLIESDDEVIELEEFIYNTSYGFMADNLQLIRVLNEKNYQYLVRDKIIVPKTNNILSFPKPLNIQGQYSIGSNEIEIILEPNNNSSIVFEGKFLAGIKYILNVNIQYSPAEIPFNEVKLQYGKETKIGNSSTTEIEFIPMENLTFITVIFNEVEVSTVLQIWANEGEKEDFEGYNTPYMWLSPLGQPDGITLLSTEIDFPNNEVRHYYISDHLISNEDANASIQTTKYLLRDYKPGKKIITHAAENVQVKEQGIFIKEKPYDPDRMFLQEDKCYIQGKWKMPDYVYVDDSVIININFKYYTSNNQWQSASSISYYSSAPYNIYYDNVPVRENGVWIDNIYRNIDFGNEPQLISQEAYELFEPELTTLGGKLFIQTPTNNNPIYAMQLNSAGNTATEPYLYNYSGFYYPNLGYQLLPSANQQFDNKAPAVGDLVLIDYYTEKAGGSTQIDITPDKFAGNYYLEASTLFKDESGKDQAAEFIIPNCKIQSNFTFNMASSGDPSTFNFTMDAFPDYTRFDKSKKVLAALQIVKKEANSSDTVRKRTAHK